MPTVDFREHLARVGARPGMFGLDERYRSAVAYVEGCNAATGRELLDGFESWLLERMPQRGLNNRAWFGLVVYRRFPERSGPEGWDLTGDEESLLTADLFALINDFLSGRPCIFEVQRTELREAPGG